MSNGFCVSLTRAREDVDRATVGFMLAGAALASEKDTLVFLSADGVWAAVRGEAETMRAGEPFAPLHDLIRSFLDDGGRIQVCTPCMQARGITVDRLIDGAVPAGGAALVEFLSSGAPCLSY